MYNGYSVLMDKGRRKDVLEANTVFGGIGDFVNTEAGVAGQINVTASDIQLLEIDSENNIRFFIEKNYSDQQDNYKSNNTTFFYDFDGKIINFTQRFFGVNSPLQRVISLSEGLLVNQCFRLTQLTYAILPNISGSIFTGNINQINTLKRIYLPSWQNTIVDEAGYFSGNQNSPNPVWYFAPNLETIRDGEPHASISAIISNGGIVRYIQNTDKPNAVTNLSVSNITSNSAQLDFTPPAINTNSNDFYYVYIDYAGISFKFKYNTKHEISAFFEEITGSGDTITGLPSATQISVQIQTVDFYHNVSEYSNKVTFTTTTIDTTALFQNAVAYYKLDETSGDAIDLINANNGTLVGGVTQGVAGKIGNAYSFDGVDGYVNTSSYQIPNSNSFAVSLWVFFEDYGGGSQTLYGNRDQGIWLHHSGSANNVYGEIKRGGQVNIPTGDMNNNEWFHIVFMRDENNRVSIWLNGVEKENTIFSGTIDSFSNDIGRTSTFSPFYFKGKLDEISIFNSALTQAQISELYNNGNGITI